MNMMPRFSQDSMNFDTEKIKDPENALFLLFSGCLDHLTGNRERES